MRKSYLIYIHPARKKILGNKIIAEYFITSLF